MGQDFWEENLDCAISAGKNIGKSEKEVKGSVRRKINSLPFIIGMFENVTNVEEDFSKNRIKCALAAGNSSVTLGFVVVGKAKPMTLLNGNELDESKAKSIDLVLRRKSGDDKFMDIILGDVGKLTEYVELLKDELSEDLLLRVM